MTAKTLLFVHGTGVRQAAYDISCALIEQQLKEFAPHVRLERCLWGDSVGASLSEGGKSIPTYGEARGAVADEMLPALWAVLLQDPAFELRMLATTPAPPRELVPNEEDPADALLERFMQLRFDSALEARIAALGLSAGSGEENGAAPGLFDLVEGIAASSAYAECARSGFAGTQEHRTALARAVVAALQKATLESGAPALDAATRDELVASILSLLGDDVRGVGTWLMTPLAGIASYLATSHVRRKRGALTDSSFPAAGDILVYQARGARIRDFIRARIDALADQDVVLLAHSLGGIACVELLAEERPANVSRLVTFGSQAPFLYELGALATLEPGKALPAHFPPWSNFYDLNDPLSYVGEPLFPDQVNDYRVESGESFPASHSAYLHARPFWQQLRPLLRDA